MEKLRWSFGVVFILCAHLQAATVIVDPGGSTPINRARKIGMNIEMAHLADPMRAANGAWIDELVKGSGFPVLRWGYGAWEWDWNAETPLGFDYWSKFNSKDDYGTLGFREFIALCRARNITPLIMIPVEIQKFPEHSWQDIKNMAGAMASYVKSQNLSTPIYFELGNEPSFTVPQATYESRLPEMSAVIKGVSSDFRFGASPDPQYNFSTLVANAGASFDFVDFHRYAPISSWTGYFNKNDDVFFTFPATTKEVFLGECNILWPDWQGRMPNDLQGSLPLLNGFLGVIEADTAHHITSWPSHWPALKGNEPYGLFDYESWARSRQTKLFTGPIYAHRMVNENILPYRLTGESSSDPKVRVFGFTNADQSRLNLIVINKKSAAETLVINTTRTYGYVQAFVLSAPSLDSKAVTYKPHLAALTPVAGATFTTTVPANSAVCYSFHNDASSGSPGSFSLSAPFAGETRTSTFRVFNWSPSPNAASYRLSISTNSSFSSSVFDRDVGLQTSYQLVEPLLAYGTKYYWRVRAKNKNGTTDAAGNGRNFTTSTAPAAPFHSSELLNSDFEDGFKGWDTWGNLKRTSNLSEVLAGKYSAAIGPASGGMGQSLLGLVAGSSYQLHLTTRALSSIDAVSAGVIFYDPAETEIGNSTFVIPQSTSILNSVFSFTVPANTASATVWVWKEGGNGMLFADSFATTDICLDASDSTGVTITGPWTAATSPVGFIGSNYLHDGNSGKGSRSVRFTPNLPAAGGYDVFLACTNGTDRATNVPVTVTHANGSSTLSLNQQAKGGWVRLGGWNFSANNAGSVLIENTGTSGNVVADAVRFSPVSPVDGGFEDSSSLWMDWGNAVFSSQNAFAGSKALQCGTAAGGRGQRVVTGAGLAYSLSGWGKVSVQGEKGYIGVTCYDSGNVIKLKTQFEVSSTSYISETLLFTTPAGTTYMDVWAWKDAGVGGHFFADEVELKRR